MTHTARTTLALLVGCALFAAACESGTSNTTGPSPAMSPAAMPAPPPAAMLQYAAAAVPGAP